MQLHVRMSPRDPSEQHRPATPLELFFDLTFVAAVAQAASGLQSGLAHGRARAVLIAYPLVFFGIWWAWMNLTWFSSAYDTDDVAYRIAVLVQMAGVLILAAGVPRALNGWHFDVMVLGYVVMRLSMVTLWLRAAVSNPSGRRCALRYATGIAVVQVGWVAWLAVPPHIGLALFAVLAVGELAVPLWAEAAGRTAWHPRHIGERYGLFTIIVLGETVLATSRGVATALGGKTPFGDLATVVVGGLLIVFSMWWLYFDMPSDEMVVSVREAFAERITGAFAWGYGHYFVFSSIAALGTGLELAAASTHGGQGSVPQSEAGLAIAIPVVVFFVVTAVLQAKLDGIERWRVAAVSITAVVVLGLGWAAAGRTNIGVAALLMGFAVAALVAVDEWHHPTHDDRHTERTKAESLPN